MPQETPNTHSLQEARRGLAWALLLGLAVASVWGLLWLRRAWARTKAEAPLPKKTASSPGKKPRKKRKP